MARYLGRIRGSRGEVTRLGTPASGIEVEANGWDIGVRARVQAYSEEIPDDQIIVTLTRGSNSNTHDIELARAVQGQKLVEMPNLIVVVEKGVLQYAKLSDGTMVRLTVHDYDTDGSESPRLRKDENGDEYEELYA